MDLFDELAWRGLVYDATEGVRHHVARERVTGYIGFDPTAPSLHVGSFLQIMALAHLQRCGHSPVAVVGGGTGLIGDPSGKSTERRLQTLDQVEANVAGIRTQLGRFLDFDSRTAPARLVDNAEWLTSLGAIEFMREVGKCFSVNAMLTKESVKRRLASDEGITYTEFSYSLLQAYDFLVLFDRFGCTLQMGGSDQWGNITAGIELIRRARAAKAYGLVLPLITTGSGTKFGKTEAGTIWLDARLTRPYEFFQFWLNTEDADAVRYLRFFTFLDASTIEAIEAASVAAPDGRHAQRALAREVTRLVHGEAAMREAEGAAHALFSGDLSRMSAAALLQLFPNVPSATVGFAAEGWGLVELLFSSGVTRSKGEAVRLIRGGGVTVNSRRMTDEKAWLRPEEAIDGELFVIRKGKRDYSLVRIIRE